MILYALRFFWVASRGYRLRPWRSPYLRWRIETYSGIPADQVTCEEFWKFLWQERRAIWRFLRWGTEMKTLEKRLRRQAHPSLNPHSSTPRKAVGSGLHSKTTD